MTAPARIRKRFAELRVAGELGIVAYITAGDPTLDLDFPPAPDKPCQLNRSMQHHPMR